MANNAGLVLNYIPAAANAGTIRYIVAAVDVDTNTFSLLRYNGRNFVVEYAQPLDALQFRFDQAKWYRISATPVLTAGSSAVAVLCELSDIITGKTVSFIVTVNNYGPLIGSGGLFADRSYVYFNSFSVE